MAKPAGKKSKTPSSNPTKPPGASPPPKTPAAAAANTGAKPDPKAKAPQTPVPGAKSAQTKPGPPTTRQVAPATPVPVPAPPTTPRPASPQSPPPSILAEGDTTPPAPVGGPGNRFVLGPASPVTPHGDTPRALPSSYGTGRLLLVARDPRWIYAHWDLTDAQLSEFNRTSALGHLVLRVHDSSVGPAPLLVQDVHPESRNWFLHVPGAGRAYVAELGFPDRSGTWNRVALSAATLTPPDELSPETWVRFETVPFVVRPEQVVSLIQAAAQDHPPVAEAVRLAGIDCPTAPTTTRTPAPHTAAPPHAGGADGSSAANAPAPVPRWTPEQESALAELVRVDEARRVWIGSLEITELLRRQLIRGISSMESAVTGPGLPGGPGAATGLQPISSLGGPSGGPDSAPRGFRFEVNTELVVYGATEPDAKVHIAGRPVRLRPDGSFAFRFALPDGDFELPIVATSADAVEQRSARLSFRRNSAYSGHVGSHPQDPALRPPAPENVD